MKKITALSFAFLLSACGANTEQNSEQPRFFGSVSTEHSSAKLASTTPGERKAYDIGWTQGKLVGVAKSAELGNFQLATPEVRLQDISLTFDKDNLPGQLFRLYQAAFGRTPDVAGFGYWKDILENKGFPLTQVANEFLNSTESKSLYGTDSDDTTFVERLYQNVLHRKPDAAGANFWIGTLRSGTKRTDVLISFSESPENQTATAVAIMKGMAFAEPGISYIPVSNAVAPADVPVGVFFEVDGSTSTDANGDQLQYNWSVSSRPNGSVSEFTSSNTVKPKIVLDKPGKYELSLWVNDATSKSYSPAKIMVTAHAIVADSGIYTCSTIDSTKAQALYFSGHTYLDRDKDGLACSASDIAYERSPSVPSIADTGTYKCSTLSPANAILLYLQGHTYLDRDHDGKPCEASDVNLEKTIYTPPSTSPSSGMCWVNGYTRKDGTRVSGYYRHC
ncbi:DUF4214 domain-containing protein [Massilia forsythiae]|uniref:DUF4214 domain-containing protein n=1 Tax=Massilia forsythiae TaxID=2728020 RepID=A0A7Z2VUQ4_9BURK|nr:DUF4214 domain-containing protein [Massilia forsythiae]QJD99548.1 DUF4214 domain-containing protein [Massilia forsythiae]